MQQVNKRKYITVLTVFSALAVVLLHSNSCFWSFSYENYWLTANVIESVFYFAVPIFFMISGVTLMDYKKRYSTKVFFEKRICKTVIPFLAWSMIGLLYMLNTERIEMADVGKRWLINSILNTSIMSIYWYFIPQFAIYLILPFISAIPELQRKKVFGYVIAMELLFNITFPFLFSLLNLNYNNALNIPLGGYTIYILLGYYIDQYEISTQFRKLIYIFGVIGLLLHIIGTWYLSYASGQIVSLYKGYLNLPCVLYSTSIYLFFRSCENQNWINNINKRIAPIAGTTLGIYLIHWYILDWFTRHMSFINPQSLVYRIPFGILCFLLAAVLTKILQTLPIIRYIVPR